MIKKGVSNFIGAVLLIAIVIGVALFVGDWYINLAKTDTNHVSKQITSTLDCNDVSLNYRDVKFNESGNGFLRFYLENTGSKDAVIDEIRVIADNGSYEDFNQKYDLSAGNEQLIIIQVDTNNIKKIDSIRVIPQQCPSRAITIEKEYITSYPE